MPERKLGFVLMPSGNHGEYQDANVEADFVFTDIIVPALNRAYDNKIDILREVDNRSTGAITRDLIQHIARADVCIVDVTGQNPNVFFELGIRYGLRRSTTILLKQPKTIIPFDIANYRWIEYTPKYSGVKRAIDDLVDTLQSVQHRGAMAYDSLVFEVFPDLEVRIPGVLEETSEVFGTVRRMPWNEYWKTLHSVVDKLRDLFKNGRYVPDVVLGISNGGLMYADLLGRELFTGVTVLSLWADRVNKEGKFFDNAINDAILNGIHASVPEGKELTEILLVDDIVASGNTLKQALLFLQNKMPSAHISFLPLFSKNEKYYESVKEHYLWSAGLFQYTDEQIMKIHATDRDELPYGKELRST